MRTRTWWLIGLIAALLSSGFAQTLVLTNGDVNGDNGVDDADLLEVLFNFGNSTTAPADLNGDGIVDDADLLIVLFNFGAQGAPTFAGQVQSPQGAFSVSLTVRLRDWVGSAQPVKVQLKPVGTESDATVPIFEYSASVGGTDTTVPLDNLPAGAYTVRAFAVASGRWLRTELSEPLVVPGGAVGVLAAHVPAPRWAEAVIPADSVPAAGVGGGASRAHRVNLASGVYEHAPEPDLVVSNPSGPDVRWSRFYSTYLAREGRSSVGLPTGWTHSYDIRLRGDLNGLTLHYPNGAVEALTVQQVGAQWLLNAPAGAPYRGIGTRNQAQGRWDRIRIHFQDGSAWEFEPAGGQEYRLTRVYGRGSVYSDIGSAPPSSGLFIKLEYDAQGRLSRLLSGANTVLLSLSYAGGYLQSATARTHNGTAYATVSYTVQQVSGVACLTAVSQVNNASVFSWRYGYEVRAGVPYLVRVETPHPSGSGVSVSQIVYGANGVVALLIDANGNVRSYRYRGSNGRAQVKVYRADGTQDFSWTQKVGASNVSTGVILDGEISVGYTYTYRPTQYTDRNGHTSTMTRDQWGNPLTITTPRGIQWNFVYNYPATYPIEPMISVTVSQVGYDGSTRTPTIYEFYQYTDYAQGAVKGLLARVRSPRPGTINAGVYVDTEFYYTPLGNVAMIKAPGPNDDGRKWTTVFFYTVDPWGGGPFQERQNQPVAVAVYDKTLTLAEYNAIPTNAALRDDRLIAFERYRYDARGNLIAIQDAAGFTTNLTYNSADQLERVDYPVDSLNSVQARHRFLYRYVGGPLYAVEVYNGSTRVRLYQMLAGAEGEARGLENAGERKADMGYDAQYRLRGVQGGRNATTGQRHTTEYSYTSANFPEETRYPNGDTYRAVEYDGEGNLLRRLDAQGLLTLFVRDLAVDSRLERIEYPDNTGNIWFEYDGFNRIQRARRYVPELSDWIIVEYDYDDNDLITRVRTKYPGVAPREVSYTYYPDGSRKRMDVAGNVFTYTYSYHTGTLGVSGESFAGLRVRVRLPVPTGFNADSWYDRRGLLRAEFTTNGVYREYHYNGRGLLTHLYNRQSLNLSNRYADFTNLLYDAAGNLLQMSVSIPAFGSAPALQGNVVYQYDAQDRLVFENAPWYDQPFTATYDGNDNATQFRGVAFASNSADQIANTGWVYQNGDLVRMVRYTEGSVLSYNREHQLVRYYNPNASPAIDIRYFYRPDGLLAGRIAPNYFRWYLYDGSVPVAEVDGTSGNLVLLYAYSPEGLTQRFAPRGSDRRLYTFDPLGNVVHRVEFDPAYPNVLSTAWHDQMGDVYLDKSSTGVDPFPTPDVLDGYLARYGLLRDPWTRPWNRARLTGLTVVPWGTAFDPKTGRYTSRTGGSQNLYMRLYRPEKNFADANWNLVVAFAHWGYTVGDPAASEGERFLAGLNALGRLLSVGSEWGSYASPIGGAAGRGLAREVAEEASETIGKQFARQASRELKPVVIGENMKTRVEPYARRIGAETIDDWLAGRKWTLELNAVWVQEMMKQGRRVIDIGPDFARRAKGVAPSTAYGLERKLLKGYPNYERRFLRWRKLRGGNPEIDRHEPWHYILDEF